MLEFAGRLPREAKRRTRRYAAPYINRVNNKLHVAKERLLDLLYSAGTFTIKSCLITLLIVGIFIWLVLSATAIYAFIYWMYMPTIFHNLPVHFDFSGSSPVAMVSLTSKQWSYSDYTLTLIQPADDRYRLLYGGQPYSIFVDMRIPESPSNYDMGMMNIKMDLLTHAPEPTDQPNGNGNGHDSNNGNVEATTEASPSTPTPSTNGNGNGNGNHRPTSVASLYSPSTSQAALTNELSKRAMLATSTRPFVAAYKSSLVRWMSTIIWAAPLLTGLTTESQTVSVQLFEDYRELVDTRCSAVRITLLSRGGMMGDNNRFQVYEASLRFVAELRGLKYFAYYWFITSALIWISFILGFELIVIAIVGWYIYARCFAGGDDQDRHDGMAAAAVNGNGNGDGFNGFDPRDNERRGPRRNDHHRIIRRPQQQQQRQRRPPPVQPQYYGDHYHDEDDADHDHDDNEWRIVNDDYDDQWDNHDHDDAGISDHSQYSDGDYHDSNGDDDGDNDRAASGLRHRHPTPPPPQQQRQTPPRNNNTNNSNINGASAKKRSSSSSSPRVASRRDESNNSRTSSRGSSVERKRSDRDNHSGGTRTSNNRASRSSGNSNGYDKTIANPNSSSTTIVAAATTTAVATSSNNQSHDIATTTAITSSPPTENNSEQQLQPGTSNSASQAV